VKAVSGMLALFSLQALLKFGNTWLLGSACCRQDRRLI
jgi:hypothetical protein